MKQQETARQAAHHLAGRLGMFGYVKASKVAKAIERLLESTLSQETLLANQLAQLLKELDQEIAKMSTKVPIAQKLILPFTIISLPTITWIFDAIASKEELRWERQSKTCMKSIA
ncbi:hypothetical protein PCC6912_60050 [Chlorogloeopsis fritschii PCC 6912]|uniref:HPt domain-containing protein n=1 Tax=Chlorogloeopsis fritschii PCC 6912 TaxID=211165 RepID=A0A433MXH8_CHLFR|nr:Hpt domain-containing protein [Chlorogloeopsis fritschii]RUR72863.1 hypothetical protein PCC6912_60050 [Chlorogloeopsis fritschii PCC 6912]